MPRYVTDGGLLGIELFRQLILKLEPINRLVIRVIYILTNSRRKVCSIIVARNLYCLICLGVRFRYLWVFIAVGR